MVCQGHDGGVPGRQILVMASVFGDESADEKVERVFAVAAIMGTDRQWEDFNPAWNAITEGQVFHAAKWESEFAHDPDRTKHKKRLESYRRLTELLAWSGMHGWGVAVDLFGWRKYFPNITPEFAYHRCFLEVADRLIRDAIGMRHQDLKFTFDGREGKGTTGLMYDWISSQREWKDSILFADEISFANRKNPRIQAADLLARETMKGLDHKLKGKKLRKSLVTLADTAKHFQFGYLMEEFFCQVSQKMDDMQKVAGFCEADYREWLKKKRLHHSLSSMHRFLIWHDTPNLHRR